jgi:hypothetical protein
VVIIPGYFGNKYTEGVDFSNYLEVVNHYQLNKQKKTIIRL